MNVRGTTPTHVFAVDLDLTGAEVVCLTYRQGGNVLDKQKGELAITPERVEVRLTQEETLMFAARDVQVQFRARFPDGTAVASNIMTVRMDGVLKGGVI